MELMLIPVTPAFKDVEDGTTKADVETRLTDAVVTETVAVKQEL